MRGRENRVAPIATRTLAMVLRPAPVLSIIAMAAALAVALKTAPFGLMLAFIVLSWNARHSIAMLHSLGAGAGEVPVLSLEMVLGTAQGWRSFLGMLVMISALFATGAAAFWVGPIAALAAATVAAAILPVALLLLGWTNSIAQALHPPTWWRVARALGGDFVQLEVAGVVVAGLVAVLSTSLHTQLMARIAVMLLGWLLLVALAGVTMHARRADLATLMPFYAGIERPVCAEELARRRQESIDTIYAQWRNGARAEAWQGVEQLAAAAPSRAEELRALHQQALHWDAPALRARIAQELVNLDLQAGRSGYALRVVREQLAVDAKFRPLAPQQTLQLVGLALQFSEPGIAATLLEGFEQRTTDEGLRSAAARLREDQRLKRGA